MKIDISNIDVEIWDREDADNYEDGEFLSDMVITIYQGASDSSEFRAYSISDEEAEQITGTDASDLLGFTEWMTGAYLLMLNLPEDVRSWATATIAEYTGKPAEELETAVKLVQAVQELRPEDA